MARRGLFARLRAALRPVRRPLPPPPKRPPPEPPKKPPGPPGIGGPPIGIPQPVRRLGQGDLINPSGQRTQLARSYDAVAETVVTRAIRNLGSPVRYEIASPRGDQPDRGGLTAHERAFKQAVNYEKRVYRHGRGGYTDENGWHQNPNPDRTHAISVKYTNDRTARGRVCWVQAHEIGMASVYSEYEKLG